MSTHYLTLFSLLLLAACGPPTQERPVAQPSAARVAARPVAPARPAPAAPANPPTTRAHPTSELADSLQAFCGVRPMHFRCLTNAALRAEIGAKPYGADTVAGRFIVLSELFKPARILYRSPADSACWIQFQPEPVGDVEAIGGNFTLDTVQLAPQCQVLLLNVSGHNGFWGGSLDYGLTALIDVTNEPRLLLKTESLRQDSSYGRESDTVYDEDAAGSEGQEQHVSVRNGYVVVSPPAQTNRQGSQGALERAVLRPVPESMLPAGRYRYQGGRLVRVGH